MDIEQLSTNPNLTVRCSGQPAHNGTAVVYWMRRAQRATDNPTLETAIAAANSLGKPVVPLTLVRHYVRQFGVAYLQAQTDLEPHPKELMLRNHV